MHALRVPVLASARGHRAWPSVAERQPRVCHHAAALPLASPRHAHAGPACRPDAGGCRGLGLAARSCATPGRAAAVPAARVPIPCLGRRRFAVLGAPSASVVIIALLPRACVAAAAPAVAASG